MHSKCATSIFYEVTYTLNTSEHSAKVTNIIDAISLSTKYLSDRLNSHCKRNSILDS